MINSCLYRAGGMGKELTANPTWMPMWMRNTKFRDFGCPTILTILLTLMFGWNWWLILCWFLLFGALTTYWDDFSKHFKDQDLWCWIFVGLGYSISILPWVISTGAWIGFILRTLYLTTLTAVWSLSIDSAEWEEYGRGFLLVATLPLFMIG